MLTFNIKKVWFEKIKSGEKTHEYRLYTDYWGNRLLYRKLPCQCVFALGYPAKNDKARRLNAIIKNVSAIENGITTDLKTNETVLDIEFELTKEQQMKSKLEQEFFRVFGIEPKKLFSARQGINPDAVIYPEITAEKLLEMIIIRATNYKDGTVIELEPDSNIEDLKYEVLRHFIDYRGNFDKEQIRQLFQEDNQ